MDMSLALIYPEYLKRINLQLLLKVIMTLHIGSMIPDRSLDESTLIKAITKIATDLARLRDQHSLKMTPDLDIIFLLPSRQEKADFAGLRLHSFDDVRQSLRFESAVPENMVSSIHAERFVIAILLDAIDAASEFFTERHILFNAPAYQSLVERINTNELQAII
jgi:hypothetical protein